MLTVVVAACSSPPPPPLVNKLKVTQAPVAGQAGVVLKPPLVVQVRAADDQVATAATTHISVALGLHPVDAQLFGTREQDAVAGVAVFDDLSIDKEGSPYTLFVSAPNFDEDSSAQFLVEAAPARNLAFAVQPSNISLGSTFAPVVEVVVLDATLQQVVTDQGTVVSLTLLNSSGGFAFGNTAVTTGGAATFPTLSFGEPGDGLALRASAPGYGSADSVTFNVGP